MPLFEIRSGGPSMPDGVYPVILTDIKGPKTVVAQRGPNAGEEVQLFDWTFAVDQPGHPLDGTEINGSTSTSSGPRSKMFAWLTALLNGAAPAVGTAFEKEQLVGRRALATIQKDADGWPRLVNLGAMPVSMQQQSFAAATGAPVVPPAAVPAAPAPAPQFVPQQIIPPQPPPAAAPNPTPAPATVPAVPPADLSQVGDLPF